MEEQVLIKSEHYTAKLLLIILMGIGILLSLVLLVSTISHYSEKYDEYLEIYSEHQETYTQRYDRHTCEYCDRFDHSFGKETYTVITFEEVVVSFIPFISLSIVGFIIMLILRSYELTVTNMRIIGKIFWGRTIILPVGNITAVATARITGSIYVSTPSGKIFFGTIKNAAAIFSVINDLIIERDQQNAAPMRDPAEQIKKYGELLHLQMITPEEFEQKKKALLNI